MPLYDNDINGVFKSALAPSEAIFEIFDFYARKSIVYEKQQLFDDKAKLRIDLKQFI